MTRDTFQAKLLSVQRNLLNFAYSLTSNRDDAQDLLQETSLHVLSNKDKYVESTNFIGWVFTIMRNLFINGYRREQRMSVLVDRSDDLYQLNFSRDSGVETPEEAMGAKEIGDLIASMPPEFSRPFSLFVSGYSYIEISRAMGIPLGTVKSRIFLVRRRLKNALSAYR